MYVRGAKNRDEAWLLDHIEGMGLDETAFRSRDYVIALDEESNEKAGFGRIRIHKTDDGEHCELTSLGVLEGWRGRGVGAHIVERLIEKAADEGFETVYAFVPEPGYLEQFGFERIDESDLPDPLRGRYDEKRAEVAPDAVPLELGVEAFTMPRRLRDAFKEARAGAESPAKEGEEDPEESAEDFGIDPDTATYKYDTGG